MYLTLVTFITMLQATGWEMFAETRYELVYMEDIGYEIEMPIFDDEIKEKEGTNVTLTGFYLPINLKGNRIIISQFPYATCFFCGGRGWSGIGCRSRLFLTTGAIRNGRTTHRYRSPGFER